MTSSYIYQTKHITCTCTLLILCDTTPSCSQQDSHSAAAAAPTDGDSYFEYVSDEAVADDGDGALPERAAVHVALRVERRSQEGEADESVEVEEHEAENSHPQQRASYSTNTHRSVTSLIRA